MKSAFKALSLFFLLISSMPHAFAGHAHRQEWREEMRALPLPQPQEDQRDGRQGRRADRGRDTGIGSSGAPGMQGSVSPNGPSDEARRPGRMTPEERRALRRQINEAGRDIYTPAR